MNKYDVVVIGGGIAGMSVASQLSADASVLVLEQENQLAYHATGRSAALFAATYGSEYPAIFALSRASADFFANPPPDLYASPLLSKRGLLYVAHTEKTAEMQSGFNQMRRQMPDIEWLDSESIQQKLPPLQADYCSGAIFDPNVFDVDVHGLMEGFRKCLLHNGGTVNTAQRVQALQYQDKAWQVSTESATYSSPIVINAAGAWADQLAELAGIAPLGIRPLRRSVILVDPPAGESVANWPMVVQFWEQFYFKPDAGQLLVSPADESLSAPCDSRPEQLDIAMAADYLQQALGTPVSKINHSWSGLRTFVDDRSPVVGYSDDKPGFFWLAALGGYGVQTAPAMGRFAAALVMHRSIPDDISALGMKLAYLSPARCG